MDADLTKVRQSLLNLLSNAAKFTENGSITVDAFVETAPDTPEVIHIAVTDTGRGIPLDKLPALFQPFSQVDRHSTREPGGTGLGLVITRRFCQMMGGDVTVESEYGKGSRFTITLPRHAASKSANDDKPAVPVSPAPDPEERDDRPTVLVIDDDAAARELMVRFLNREQFRTVQAASGEEGLRLARQLRPDVITLDVLMPGLDGWTVLQNLKQTPTFPVSL